MAEVIGVQMTDGKHHSHESLKTVIKISPPALDFKIRIVDFNVGDFIFYSVVNLS